MTTHFNSAEIKKLLFTYYSPIVFVYSRSIYHIGNNGTISNVMHRIFTSQHTFFLGYFSSRNSNCCARNVTILGWARSNGIKNHCWCKDRIVGAVVSTVLVTPAIPDEYWDIFNSSARRSFLSNVSNLLSF